MNKIKDETGSYVELPRNKITFYGDTEKERKANEQLFDMSLELSGLYDENNELKQEIDRLNKALDVATEMINNKQKVIVRLNNIIDELEKVFIECDYQHLQRKLKSLKENNNE